MKFLFFKRNNKFNSLYYETFPSDSIKKPELKKTALLIIDMQNQFANPKMGLGKYVTQHFLNIRWKYYFWDLKTSTIPNIKKLLCFFRENQLEVNYSIIVAQHEDGRDRSLVHKLPGFNQTLLTRYQLESSIIDELKPQEDEIVLEKTTDSVLMGTNYERMLRNMGIENVIVTGIMTDQCVSSTVRTLADAGFYVYLPFDATSAATEDIKNHELKVLNHVYAKVLSTKDLLALLNNF
jgi:nicotinamidase-related amidase